MKSLLPLALFLAVGLSIASAREGVLRGEREQPHMEEAMAELQEARDSKDPLPLLQKAKKNLEEAKHNKAGRRPEAIEQIDYAIEMVKNGQDPKDKITRAIAEIRAGMDHGR